MCCCNSGAYRGVAKRGRIRPLASYLDIGKLEAQCSDADRLEVMGLSGHERMLHAGSGSMGKHKTCFCGGRPLHQSGHANLLVDRNRHGLWNGRCHAASMHRNLSVGSHGPGGIIGATISGVAA